MKTDTLYSHSVNNATEIQTYAYYEFEYDDNSRLGAYYKKGVEN